MIEIDLHIIILAIYFAIKYRVDLASLTTSRKLGSMTYTYIILVIYKCVYIFSTLPLKGVSSEND